MDRKNYWWTIAERLRGWLLGRSSSRQNHLYSSSLVDNRQAYVNGLAARGVLKSETLDIPLSLSVVLHDNSRYLDAFFRSLVEQSFPCARIDLYLVDNGSTSEENSVIKRIAGAYSKYFRSFNLITQDNLGYGRGHHSSLEQMKTRYALITNVDIEFQHEAITEALHFAQADEEKTAAWELRQQPLEHPKYYDPVTLETAWTSHASVLMRTDYYHQVGGYEPRIFMYGEDVELSYRFRREGYKLRYLPKACIVHHNLHRSPEAVAFQISSSMEANFYIRLRYGNFYDIIVGYLLLMGVCAGGMADRRATGMIRSRFWGILLKSPHFLSSRRKSSAYFPFRTFDYELTRFGAEYHSTAIPLESTRQLPKISVITRTVAGRSGMLKECIASVGNQTYPNIEHIIIEDGGHSYQNIIEKALAAEAAVQDVRYIPCEKVGRAGLGNRAMNASTGDYITFLDDDDLLFADHIETLVDEVREQGSDGAYTLAWDVYTNMIDMDKGRYEEVMHVTPPIFHQEFDRRVLAHHNYLPIQSVLFKRELFHARGGFDESLEALEDWVLWKNFAVTAKFSYVPKLTSLFRTPANPTERATRHAWLHDAYENASKIYKTELLESG